jgi:dipeptide/tripeptide permease
MSKTWENKKMAENSNNNNSFFGQFNKTFWVVNTFELFERGAYYGTMSILGIHVYKTLLPDYSNIGAVWGMIYAMLIFLLYFIPLISAALAEKYGYRNVLLVSFSILIVGYFLLFLVQPGQLAFLIFALIMVGIGAGAFKPIISASIAHVTREEQRNLAYSIYYWMINLGAFLMPMIIGFLLPTEQLFYFVFLISAILIGINLAINFFMFFDPVEPQKDISIPNAIKRIVPALRDRKFVLLLAIYAGFWFMFALNHTFLPWYMVDFKRMPEWFAIPFLATINPGTIIFLGPFLGKLVEKYKSLNVVMVGLIIFCIGLLIIGFSTIPALFVAGIIIFSIGEFITHPGFIAHVSKIAPKDRVAIYMACIFLSTGSGNIIGGAVQGAWYDYFCIQLQMPKVFFALILSVGLLTLISFILYNQWIIRGLLKKDPEAKVEKGIWTKTSTIGIVFLFIPGVIIAAYLGGPNTFYAQEEEVLVIYEENVFEDSDSGYTNENNQADVQFEIPELNYRLSWVNCTLTWQDEGSNYFQGTNEPDEFKIILINPNGDTLGESALSTSGTISLNTPLNHSDENFKEEHTGTWMIVVEAGTCGDDSAFIPLLGLRVTEDMGNVWSLEYSYTYYLEK